MTFADDARVCLAEERVVRIVRRVVPRKKLPSRKKKKTPKQAVGPPDELQVTSGKVGGSVLVRQLIYAANQPSRSLRYRPR